MWQNGIPYYVVGRCSGLIFETKMLNTWTNKTNNKTTTCKQNNIFHRWSSKTSSFQTIETYPIFFYVNNTIIHQPRFTRVLPNTCKGYTPRNFGQAVPNHMNSLTLTLELTHVHRENPGRWGSQSPWDCPCTLRQRLTEKKTKHTIDQPPHPPLNEGKLNLGEGYKGQLAQDLPSKFSLKRR